ncbi:retrotransposon protein, putative, ty1-copia subclass [Tanacetum coccineum]
MILYLSLHNKDSTQLPGEFLICNGMGEDRRVQKNQKNKPHKVAKGGQGKGKNKMGYASNNVPFAPKPKTPPPPKKDNLAKDAICHHCGEIGHWRRNYPGLRGSKKLKPGALSLYVGIGNRAAVEAIGSYHLELPISKNNLVYFVVVPRDGIFEIDMSCSNTNDSSMYNVSNKRAKINLDSSYLWHCRLGHISKKCIEKLQHEGLLNSTDIQSLGKCVSCMSGKMARKPYSHQVERAKDLLGLIHTDVCGPFKIVSRQGASYFVTFTDDFSRYGYVYLLKHKHEVFETFKVFQKEVENQLGKTIKSLSSDRGGEYMSQQFLDHLKKHGIIAHRTPPYMPQTNGVSERGNRTLLDMVRSMMSQTTLPKSFWDYALETAARILNMVPTKKVDKIPYEVWHGQAPKLSYLKVWGCEALVKRDTLTKPDKLDPRSFRCIFVGYPKETMGYSFYSPSENKVFVARNAEFFENDLIDLKASGSVEDLEIIQEEDTNPSVDTSLNHEEDDQEIDEPQSDINPIRRSTRTRRPTDRLCLYIDAEEHELGDLGEPANYKAALLDPESKKWLDAMNVEMQSMKDNDVWVLVELPPNARTVGSKWLFKKKTDMDGAVYVFKARLVAKGFTQTYGVDYEETFSPVADIRAIRILIAIAAYYDYEIWQMDVKTAFLNGHLSEEVYMEQPEGFVDPKYPNHVCKLKRSIYGLKQASRQWNKRFDDEIKKFGFTQNRDEPCVYLKASGSYIAILILYVDDILLMGNNIPMLQDVKSYLGKCFAMKDLGDAAYILGIKIYRDRSKRLIGLCQSAYIEKILKRYSMENSKRGTIPMQEKLKLSKSQGASTPAEIQRMQKIPYASAVGSIMYVVRCTRPDVAFAQNMTSRFQQNPGKIHWTTVKNILKCLRNTKDMFLVYGRNMERELRVLLTGKAQSKVSLLLTDAEYIAAFDASKEAVWIRKFISGLGIVPTIEEPISMYYDNTRAIAIAKDHGITKGARHFLAKVHYLRETIEMGDVKIEKVDTEDNLTNPFTKALAYPKHSELTKNIGLIPANVAISVYSARAATPTPKWELLEYGGRFHKLYVEERYISWDIFEEPELDPIRTMKQGILNVKVLRAMNLKTKSSSGACDPYVILRVTEGWPSFKKTTVKRNNLNPKWYEEFNLDVKHADEESLEIFVHNGEKGEDRCDECLGNNIVQLKDITPEESNTLAINLLSPGQTSHLVYSRDKKEKPSLHFPVWGSVFVFSLEKPPRNELLHMEVVSTSCTYPEESLGYVSINLTDVGNDNDHIEKLYDLSDPTNGQLHVELQWITSH